MNGLANSQPYFLSGFENYTADSPLLLASDGIPDIYVSASTKQFVFIKEPPFWCASANVAQW